MKSYGECIRSFCGLDRVIENAQVKSAGYDNSEMVNNLTVGQNLSVWQEFSKLRGLYDDMPVNY